MKKDKNNKDRKGILSLIDKLSKINIGLSIVIVILLIIDALLEPIATEESDKKPIYVEFEQLEDELDKGDVDTVYIDPSAVNIRYTLLTEDTEFLTIEERNKIPISEKQLYITGYPNGDDNFNREVLESGAQLVYKDFGDSIASDFVIALIKELPFILFMGLALFMSWRITKKQFEFGTSKAKLVPENTNVTFDDIIGQDEVIKDIKMELKLMQNESMYKELNARPVKGLLLAGPPGTGKTMIAKALANEAKIKFFYINSSSIIDRFVGMGAKNVRDAFETAKKNQPCILFFDEIDAIGSNRDNTMQNSENTQTLNALLQELDGFETSDKVYLIAATNRMDRLDPALVRPGRFDRKIVINPPRDSATRLKLFEHYLKDATDEEVDLQVMAKQTAGFTGADIAQICNEAKVIAIQNDKKKVSSENIEEALDKFLFNGNRTRNEYKKDLEIVAYHESGHALSMLLNGMPVARISVIPNTSGVGGMVVQQDEETLFISKKTARNKIKSLYSGRIAEELVFGSENITSGASNDIEQAQKLLEKYVIDLGFDTETGLAAPKDETDTKKRISELAKVYYETAKEEIKSHMDVLEKIEKQVIEKETMTGSELTELYKNIMIERGSQDEILDSIFSKETE